MFNKKGLLLLGLFLGLIGPPIVMYSFFYWNYYEVGFETFINRLLYSTLFAPVLSLCVLINLLLFFTFIWLNRDDGARGVLFSTLLYAFVVLTMKLF